MQGASDAAANCRSVVAMILAYHCMIHKLPKQKDKEEKAKSVKELKKKLRDRKTKCPDIVIKRLTDTIK